MKERVHVLGSMSESGGWGVRCPQFHYLRIEETGEGRRADEAMIPKESREAMILREWGSSDTKRAGKLQFQERGWCFIKVASVSRQPY